MIKEINMRSCATYDANGISLKDCPKVNFIYGPNGSGKSTISNYLQNPTDPFYAHSSIVWNDALHPDIMVYNRRFRGQNFSSNSDIAGVFTLGRATIEDIQHLEELKALREKRKTAFDNESAAYTRFVEQRNETRIAFRETVWNVILKKNDKQFKEAFSGLRSNKDKFRDKVLERFQNNHASEHTYEELVLRSETLYAEKPETCVLFVVPDEELLRATAEVESNSIFQTVIVGNQDIPIGRLIQSLHNSDWVNFGRHYIGESAVCPFCQKQTIDDAFRYQLEAFFSGEYENKLSLVTRLYQEYDQLTSRLLAAFKSVVSNSESCRIGKLDADLFLAKIKLLENTISGNMSAMLSKKMEPGKVVAIKGSVTIVQDLLGLIRGSNVEIQNHNQMVLHLSDERKKLTDDIWTFLMDKEESLIQGYLDDESAFEKAKTGKEKKLRSLKEELDQLRGQIVNAGKNITSVQPTVDEINRSLLAYGFENFQIAPSPNNSNMYRIQRPDGSAVANTLSEGEETFITFLYFLQLAKGSASASAVSNKRILVIDDPICSLDSTILYVVSAMVKSLIKSVKEGTSNIEQIFILTHNVFFHKEASFVNGRSNPEPTVNFWVLRKNESVTAITPYGMKNPISTSYELLWQELKTDQPGSIITTQNTMRRIIENYFGLLGGAKEDYIVGKFETIEDQMICRSLFHWINDGSHSIPDDLFFDVQSASIAKYKEIFRKIFIVTGHKAHYDMMMGIEPA